MGQLEELEAIKRVKYAYLRCVDTKDWVGLAETFSEDARCVYDNGQHEFSGRAAIVGFLRQALDRKDILSVHQCHHPELELVSPTRAEGTWYLEDFVINAGEATEFMPENAELRGAA